MKKWHPLLSVIGSGNISTKFCTETTEISSHAGKTKLLPLFRRYLTTNSLSCNSTLSSPGRVSGQRSAWYWTSLLPIRNEVMMKSPTFGRGASQKPWFRISSSVSCSLISPSFTGGTKGLAIQNIGLTFSRSSVG